MLITGRHICVPFSPCFGPCLRGQHTWNNICFMAVGSSFEGSYGIVKEAVAASVNSLSKTVQYGGNWP